MTKRKVVLVGVAGSNNSFSLSLYNLKSYAYSAPAIKNKWEIAVLQYPLIGALHRRRMLDEIENSVCALTPELIGFSCYMWNLTLFRELAERLGARLPEAKIVFGGPEMATDYLLAGHYDDFPVDFCVSGEGERTFAELLEKLAADSSNFSAIPGLSFRKSTKDKFTINPKREPFRSLDEVPSPFLTGVVDDEVLLRKNVEANIETQRGCTLRCSYCSYHKDMGKIAYNEVGRTIGEIEYLVAKGVKRVRFVDANFGSKLAHAKVVMRALIAKRFELKLLFELIPGFIDEELASLFAEFNNLNPWNEITLGVGVQTINDQSLRLMRRRIKLETFEKTFALFRKYNIYAKIDLIIGLPGETIDVIETTLEYMMEQLRGSKGHLLCCHVMRGLPGTELLEIARQHQMIFSSRLEPHELYESPSLPRAQMLKCLRRTAVIFRLVNHEGWANWEFSLQQRAEGSSIHDAYFRAKDHLKISHIALLDLLVDALLRDLPSESY
ncbi:MAG: B12-binding domain-containing radical SAM protein, partial [Bdellovibrionota bacterium]